MYELTRTTAAVLALRKKWPDQVRLCHRRTDEDSRKEKEGKKKKRSMPQRSLIHPELVVNSSGTPPASPPYPLAVRGHQGGVSVPICR
uniref:Uncharacterized protein n=1 Tax=Gasterosteus aculeatus TaxID=69293 RepID=G3P809_GASAC